MNKKQNKVLKKKHEKMSVNVSADWCLLEYIMKSASTSMRKSPVRSPALHATPPWSTDSRYWRAGNAGVGANSSMGVSAGNEERAGELGKLLPPQTSEGSVHGVWFCFHRKPDSVDCVGVMKHSKELFFFFFKSLLLFLQTPTTPLPVPRFLPLAPLRTKPNPSLSLFCSTAVFSSIT